MNYVPENSTPSERNRKCIITWLSYYNLAHLPRYSSVVQSSFKYDLIRRKTDINLTECYYQITISNINIALETICFGGGRSDQVFYKYFLQFESSHD
jgi:hypothetical protein